MGEIVALGWPEIAELGTVELVVVAEELGYALAPTPLPVDVGGRSVRRELGGRRGALRRSTGWPPTPRYADVLVDWDGAR